MTPGAGRAGVQPPSGWARGPWGSGRPHGLLEEGPALPLCKGPWYLLDISCKPF